VVTESLAAIEGGYQVNVTVMDLTKHKNLDEFRANLNQPTLYSGPLIIREPTDGPALVVPTRVQDAHNIVKGLFPSCEKCPEPQFTNEARAKKIAGLVLLVVTITDQGTAEHIAVIRGLGSGLTESAIRAVRGWRFRPAVGPDGKPFATRTPIEVNFILKP
jgi:TonB family protein